MRQKRRGFREFLKNNLISLLVVSIILLPIAIAGNVIVNEGNIDIENNLNSSGVLFINSTSGRVGIGTANPTHTLSVVGDSNLTGNVSIRSSLGIEGIAADAVGGTSPFIQLSSASNNNYSIIQQTTKGLDFWTYDSVGGWGDRMTITSGGNVKIGTTTPISLMLASSSSLSVNTPSDDGYLCLSGTDGCDASLGAAIVLDGKSRANNLGNLELYGGGSTGNITFYTGGSLRGVITKDGKMGIGTMAPISTLSVGGTGITNTGIYGYGSGTGIYGQGGTYGIYGTGSTGVDGYGTNNGVNGYGATYDFYAYGPGTDYGTSSSIRWKSNITEINNALNKIMNLKGVYYNWKIYNNSHDMGFIAEDVGRIVPEVVQYETDISNSSNYYIDADGKKQLYATGVDYGALTPMLVEAIKEQQNIIEIQNDTINHLNDKLNLICKENNLKC